MSWGDAFTGIGVLIALIALLLILKVSRRQTELAQQQTDIQTRLTATEAVLKLRALVSNGDFPAYWAFHLPGAPARPPGPLPGHTSPRRLISKSPQGAAPY